MTDESMLTLVRACPGCGAIGRLETKRRCRPTMTLQENPWAQTYTSRVRVGLQAIEVATMDLYSTMALFKVVVGAPNTALLLLHESTAVHAPVLPEGDTVPNHVHAHVHDRALLVGVVDPGGTAVGVEVVTGAAVVIGAEIEVGTEVATTAVVANDP